MLIQLIFRLVEILEWSRCCPVNFYAGVQAAATGIHPDHAVGGVPSWAYQVRMIVQMICIWSESLFRVVLLGGIALSLTFFGPLSLFSYKSVFSIRSVQFFSMFCRLLPYGPFPFRSIISVFADVFNVYTLIDFGLSNHTANDAASSMNFNITLDASPSFLDANFFNATNAMNFNAMRNSTTSLDNVISLSAWRRACLWIGITAIVHGILLLFGTCVLIRRKIICTCCPRKNDARVAPNDSLDSPA
jgi:hypothetical protein